MAKDADGLTPRQSLFIEHYLTLLHGTNAAIAAGYGKNGADAQACRLLARPHIQQALARKREEISAKTGLTVDRIRREIARLAFSDARKAFNADGSPKSIMELDDDTAAAISSIEQSVVRTRQGKNWEIHSGVRKLKLWSKGAALDLAARTMGMLKEDRPTGDTSLAQLVEAALNRGENGDGEAA